MPDETAGGQTPPKEYRLIIHDLQIILVGLPREMSPHIQMQRHELWNVNLLELEGSIVRTLAHKSTRLTGPEASFLMHYLDLEPPACAAMLDLQEKSIIDWIQKGKSPGAAYEAFLRVRAFEYSYADAKVETDEIGNMFRAGAIAADPDFKLRLATSDPDHYEFAG